MVCFLLSMEATVILHIFALNLYVPEEGEQTRLPERSSAVLFPLFRNKFNNLKGEGLGSLDLTNQQYCVAH